MKYLKRVEGECEDCYFHGERICPTRKDGVLKCIKNRSDGYRWRLAKPDEIAAYKRQHPERCHVLPTGMMCPFRDDIRVGSPLCCGLCGFFVPKPSATNSARDANNYILCSHPSELPKEAENG